MMGSKFKHVFLDAEGTLYVPRNGKSRWEFWADPSPEAALEFFELDAGVFEALVKLRERVDSVCIVSMNREEILDALLDKFGIRDFFDAILLNGDKGKRIAEYLDAHGFDRSEAVMVGDMPVLDLYPVRAVGVEAILVDRHYNRKAKAERIPGVSELPCWLRMADIAEAPKSRAATLDEFLCASLRKGEDALAQAGTKRLIVLSGA
jgi:FMN phosphatase YigB (HAD superfamily)